MATVLTRLVFLTASVLAFAAVDRGVAQVPVTPSASLDVEIPIAPSPVRIGGRIHLVYELHITNFRAIDLALSRVDVFGDSRTAVPLASYQDAELRSRLARAGTRPDSSDTRVIAAGGRVVLFVWLALDDGAAAPSTLHHTISFRVPSTEGESGVVHSGAIDVRRDAPIILDAPLRGGPWVAVYDPSMTGGHRRALFAIAGKVQIPARFAIDWIKLGDDGRVAHGDVSVLSSFYGYGADVLAVADGVVAAAVSDLLEPTVPITLDTMAGNYLTIDLGGGRFASYEHLQPGSLTVKVGDRVRSGQLLGRVGGSGSVFSGPHLHFHVSDANSPLGAEGLPYVFRRFDVLGAFESLDAFARGAPWARVPGDGANARRLELPVNQTVLRF